MVPSSTPLRRRVFTALSGLGFVAYIALLYSAIGRRDEPLMWAFGCGALACAICFEHYLLTTAGAWKRH